MQETLADLLQGKEQTFTAQWQAGAAERKLSGGLGLPTNCYSGMLDVLRGGDSSEWRQCLRDTGAAQASAQIPVRDVISDALDFLNTMRAVVETAGLDGAIPPEAVEQNFAHLQNELLSELISGYSEGQIRKSEEIRLALDEVNGLHKIISAANSSIDFQSVIDQVVQTVADVMRVGICSLFTYEPQIDMLVLRSNTGLSREMIGKLKLRLGEGVTGWAGRTGKPVSLPNAWSDPRFIHVPFLGEENTTAMLAVPIVLFTKLKLVGVITLQTREERTFGDREIKFLETVAGEIAIAMENARLYGETDARLHQKVAELTTLQGVSATIAATLNLREVLNLIAMEAAQLVSADAAVVYEFNDNNLDPVAGYGFGDDRNGLHWAQALRDTASIEDVNNTVASIQDLSPLFAASRLPEINDPNAELIAETMKAGQTLFLGRGSANGSGGGYSLIDNVSPATTNSVVMEPYASQFCVPLAAPRGVLGSICLFSREERNFSGEQVRLLEAFAREGAIAMENARLYEATRHGLEVKTLLLREMHHRVRNNLQRAASLLRMQAQRVAPDNEAGMALQESVIRIQSIARVHDLLSREEIGVTDVGAVANLAIEVVSNTLARPDQHITWRNNAQHIPLSSQEAFPLTLLLTELLSNSVLHGFSAREEGHITVSAALENNLVTITLEDDGRGLDENFDLQKSAHLGLEVVRRLGEQELGGKLSIAPSQPGPGTVAKLTFPHNPPRPDPLAQAA